MTTARDAADDVRMAAPTPKAPLQARITAPGPPDRAYEIFTEAYGEWWPLSTHSVFGRSAASCVFEARVGGRIFERHTDGRESVWGNVLEVDPPAKLRFTWHPGREAETAQEITVRFESMMFGTTITLEHGMWEKAGEAAQQLRASYDRDWPKVLGAFVERINRK